MLGAIIGDIAGSTYEFNKALSHYFETMPEDSRYTDDTVLTVAIADAILHNRNYKDSLLEYARKYPNAGYGEKFTEWFHNDDPQPYNSFGNGSAMRVSPVGWAFDSIEKVMEEAKKTAEPSHNHPEGIKGAQATAATVFLAREGKSKTDIKKFLQGAFDYDIARTYDELKATYKNNLICQFTVPESIICFLESVDYEDAIRKAIFLGGDSDTLACITGSMAEAYYRVVPEDLARLAEEKLDEQLMITVNEFRSAYMSEIL